MSPVAHDPILFIGPLSAAERASLSWALHLRNPRRSKDPGGDASPRDGDGWARVASGRMERAQ